MSRSAPHPVLARRQLLRERRSAEALSGQPPSRCRRAWSPLIAQAKKRFHGCAHRKGPGGQDLLEVRTLGLRHRERGSRAPAFPASAPPSAAWWSRLEVVVRRASPGLIQRGQGLVRTSHCLGAWWGGRLHCGLLEPLPDAEHPPPSRRRSGGQRVWLLNSSSSAITALT